MTGLIDKADASRAKAHQEATAKAKELTSRLAA
jgi:hypothetical protein